MRVYFPCISIMEITPIENSPRINYLLRLPRLETACNKYFSLLLLTTLYGHLSLKGTLMQILKSPYISVFV